MLQSRSEMKYPGMTMHILTSMPMPNYARIHQSSWTSSSSIFFGENLRTKNQFSDHKNIIFQKKNLTRI